MPDYAREKSWSANMKAEEDESESKEEYKVEKQIRSSVSVRRLSANRGTSGVGIDTRTAFRLYLQTVV